MQVAVIDYKMGNLESVKKALTKIGINSIITNQKKEIAESDVILLPGVGAFKAGMQHLEELNLIDILNEEVIIKKKPFIGICLGMQLLASNGSEPEKCKGLGWIEGEVNKIDASKLRVPHIGWNEINIKAPKLFPEDIESKDFYFIHSYHFIPKDKNCISSTVNYGGEIVSSVFKDNIFAMQFHPEKSQNSGLKLLQNYFNQYAKN